jgi:hypothetical protein
MKKIIYFLFVCVGAFYACKDEEQVLLNADFISDKQTISAGEKVYFMDNLYVGIGLLKVENLVCLICSARKSCIIIRELIP